MEKAHVARVVNITDSQINQLNKLLDKGTFWDNKEGNKFLKNQDNSLLLAIVGKKVVGFLTAHRLQRLDKRKAEVLLYEIGVHKSYRKKGIAKQLLLAIKIWAKKVKADEVWVLTNKSNKAAVALYVSGGGTIENQDEIMYTFKI